MNDVNISVVIPVYKGRDCLDELYRRLILSLERITQNFEIILVDDACPQNSWEIIKDLASKDKRIKGINFSRNFGQHDAITAGLTYIKGDWVVVMDCDLQDQPEEIIKLYNKACEGFDVILGRRIKRQDGFLKKLFSRLFHKVLSYLTDTEQDFTIANFGIYSRQVIENLLRIKEQSRAFHIFIRWMGFRIGTVEIEHAQRYKGESSYNFSKMLNFAIDIMLAFSDKPLRLTVNVGLFISLFSLLAAIYIIFIAFLGNIKVLGWPSIMVSLWFLAGLIIFILGIIGLYVGKIFEETKHRPLYIIRETTGLTEKLF